MIKLNVPKIEKDEAKKLGAWWNKNGEFWYVPNNIDYHPFKKWIDDKTWEQLEQPIELHFADIFKDFSQHVHYPTLRYQLIADVYNEFESPTTKDIHLELIDEHKLNRKLVAIIPSNIVEQIKQNFNLSVITFKDSRIALIGQLDLYAPFGRFQIKVEDFAILGECSRIEKLKQWEEKCASILLKETANTALTFDFSKSLKIGLITAKNAAAKQDFISKLNPNYFQNTEFFIEEIELTKTENIVKSLQELQQKSCDVICLVRGGGDSEMLLPFSEPVLLYALFESSVPIITGVGHKTDDLLCKRVKGTYNADTPTGAAEYLNLLARSYRENENKARNIANRKSKDEAQKIELENLKQEIAKLENFVFQLKQEKQLLFQQLEQAKNQIAYLQAEKEKKGILRRIFG